jgi:hypothetical protein
MLTWAWPADGDFGELGDHTRQRKRQKDWSNGQSTSDYSLNFKNWQCICTSKGAVVHIPPRAYGNQVEEPL